MSDDWKRKIEEKKARLDALRPLRGATLDHLRKYYDVELTYTSNAIEGDTLTLDDYLKALGEALPADPLPR